MESTDIKLICRLCAKEDKFCVDIFGEDGVKNNISKKIRLCLPISVKEDDEFPKQICLSCLNKLDTSYELYSGCMNAQNTIKRLLKIFTRPKPPGDDICVIEQVQNDTNFMAQQLPTLSLNKPVMKFGRTIVQLQDTSSKKRNDKHTPESGLKVRQLRNERHDNQNLELDNDDPNSTGSSWQSPQLRDTSSKKRNNEYIPEPEVKVRRFKSERHDSLTLELDSDDSNTVCSPLCSLPLDEGGGGGSPQATQQVSQLGLPTKNLAACTVAPSDQMYVDGNVGSVSSSEQQFGTSGIVSKTSSVGQHVGSIPTGRATQFLGAVQTVPSTGTQKISSSSSGLAMTSSEMGDTSSQYVKFLSSMDSAVPVMAQQPTQNTIRQPQVYIPNSVCSSSPGEQGDSTAGSLSLAITQENPIASFPPLQQEMFEEKLEQSKQLCSREDASQYQSRQQGQAKQHQQYTSLKNQTPSIPAFAGIRKAKSNEKHRKSGFRPILPVDNTRLKGSSNVLITTPTCATLPHQQNLVSVNTSSPLKGKISAKTASLLQLPAVEANHIAAVPPIIQTNSQHIFISNPIQNNTSIVSDQQTEDFQGQHLYSSGQCVQAEGISSDGTVTATTSAIISTICNGKAMAGVTAATVPTTAGAVSLKVPTTLSMVTPTATSLMGIGVCAPSGADTTSVLNMGVPTVTRIGIIAPLSHCTLDMLTATTPSSTFSTTSTFSTVTSVNSTAVPDSDSTIRTEIPSTFVTSNEQISDSPLTIGKSSGTTDVRTCNTVSSITTRTTSTPTRTVATINTDSEENKNICEYCNKIFPEDIIVHHRKLHFRQRFFSCIVCGKNFRTEVGLENHRCENSAE